MRLTRREWLGGAAAMGLLGTRATAGGFFAASRRPLGVQLYTVADAAAQDLQGTFARLAAIGYRTVELAGYHGSTPRRLREAADRAGLVLAGCHVPGSAMGPGPSLDGDLPALAADLHAMGITRIAMPMLRIPARVGPPQQGEAFPAYLARAAAALTADDWQRDAAFLNEKGAALRREGIELAYHNHNPEFAPVAGTTGLDILLRETDPAILFELDAGWAAAAGVDPARLLARYPGRFRMMHVKDILPSTRPNFAFAQDPTEVGRGFIDWPALLPAAEKAGVTDFFVEQEPPFTLDRFDALKVSHDYLAGL